jgi:serine/threonine protein kinase
MGAVYKALQPSMNRMVAVKILHPKLTNRKDLVSRFRREARAMSHLTHPNTVKVLLYGELEDGSLYIVMEYLEGKNLNQVVRKEGPLKPERAIPVLIQVCGALQEAHRRASSTATSSPRTSSSRTNGGLKDYPKVLDFGLAKVTEREMRPGSIMLTQEGMVFGTPEFMSPEQAQGKTLDARSDIYSLAVILYEVLTGKLPVRCQARPWSTSSSTSRSRRSRSRPHSGARGGSTSAHSARHRGRMRMKSLTKSTPCAVAPVANESSNVAMSTVSSKAFP